MELIPIRLPFVRPGQVLVTILGRALSKLGVRKGDVVCVASKVLSTSEERIVYLDQQSISSRAQYYAKRFRIDPALSQIVISEADEILGGVKGFLLTIKSGILTANAGVDVKNSPPGTATLWPLDASKSAKILRRALVTRFGVSLGVIIVDSRVTPLRLGTTGLAVGSSGFYQTRDDRGKKDLYDRTIKVTQTNLADDLAASAHLLMCERNERTGLVIIRNSMVRLTNSASSSNLKITRKRCLICSNLSR